VYERFKPKVVEIVDSLLKKKLKIGQFESILPFGSADAGNCSNLEHSKIVVWIVGGATYGEYRELELFCREKLKNTTVYLGSDKIINSGQFLDILINEKDGKGEGGLGDEREGLLKKLN
jgi:hypothetical protein